MDAICYPTCDRRKTHWCNRWKCRLPERSACEGAHRLCDSCLSAAQNERRWNLSSCESQCGRSGNVHSHVGQGLCRIAAMAAPCACHISAQKMTQWVLQIADQAGLGSAEALEPLRSLPPSEPSTPDCASAYETGRRNALTAMVSTSGCRIRRARDWPPTRHSPPCWRAGSHAVQWAAGSSAAGSRDEASMRRSPPRMKSTRI